jgi:hypothetical protein
LLEWFDTKISFNVFQLYHFNFEQCRGLENGVMNNLCEKLVLCPYCGERIGVLLDTSIPHQAYIEDCQVCCRPIMLEVTVSPHEEEVLVTVRHEDD